MSRPYFIRLPKSVINPDFKIDYYHDVYPYPKREEILYLDYDKWLELTNNKDSEANKIYFKSCNLNSIKKDIIDILLKIKYNALQTLESGGGEGGYTMNLYIDNNHFSKVYFYTVNSYKRTKACKDFGGQKYFYINIYSIPYNLFKMLRNQNEYKFRFIQKPSGFVFNLNKANNKWCDWKTSWKNRKDINW